MRIVTRDSKSKKWSLAESATYSNEEELQRLLAGSPSLIPMDEIRDGASPLLVAIREFGLPGSGSTDLLAFTAEGDIAVVECKLDANPEIKRKVVGQILEYGSSLWGKTYEDLDEQVMRRTQRNLVTLLRDVVDTDWSEELFRERVSAALHDGDFALIVAVDEINEELKRIISYLNDCGSPTFVICALSVRRFSTAQGEMLIPSIHGPSLESKARKASGRRKWNESEFFETAQASVRPEVLSVIQDLYEWSRGCADTVSFGTGRQRGSFTFAFLRDGQRLSVFTVFTDGILCVNYEFMTKRIPKDVIAGFSTVLRSIPAFRSFPKDVTTFWSLNIAEAFVADDDSLSGFKRAVVALGERTKQD